MNLKKISQNSTYDELADEYEKNADLVKPHTLRVIKPFIKQLPKGASVLDVGCGVGVATTILLDKGFKVTAIDSSPKMIDYAKVRNPEANVFVKDFVTAKILGKYEGIVMQAFLHLFAREKVNKTLQKARKLLKPNGVIFIDTTKSNKYREGYEVKQDYEKKKSRFRIRWTEKELKKALKDNGFEITSFVEDTGAKGKIWMVVVAKKRPVDRSKYINVISL